MAAYRLTEKDLNRWIDRGMITAQQGDAIRADLRSHPQADILNVTTLTYYAGGLLVLIAYAVFLAVQWQDLASGARIFISASSLVFFGFVSEVLLRTRTYRLPGELLQVVAVAVVPLLTFSLLDAAGIWPTDTGYQSEAQRQEYYSDLTWMRMALGGATLLAAAGAFWRSRSPFVLVAVIISIASLALDTTIQWNAPIPTTEYQWGVGQSLVLAILGAATLAAGLYSRGRTERDYATWLYFTGLAGLALGLGSQAFSTNAPLWGALWMVVALAVLAASIPLQQRLFAAAGLLAVFAYLAKLVFEVFESAYASLALVVVGLLILGAGMIYQRLTDRGSAGEVRPPADPPASPDAIGS